MGDNSGKQIIVSCITVSFMPYVSSQRVSSTDRMLDVRARNEFSFTYIPRACE